MSQSQSHKNNKNNVEKSYQNEPNYMIELGDDTGLNRAEQEL